MIGTAIIGSGGIAHARHIPNIQRSSRGTLVGIYNRNAGHSRADAEKLGCRAYERLEDLLEDGDVQAVIICTPASTHCEYTLAALAAGKHVLCEKPMSTTIEEAKRMQRAEAESGKKLMISHNQRYYQPHQKAKELLDAGLIGRVLNVRSSLGLDLPMPEGSAVDYNAGSEVLSHRIDLMHHLLGSRVTGVLARLTRLDAEGCPRHVTQGDDTAMAVMAYENGVQAIFTASRVSYNGNDRTTRIFGTGGSLTLYGQMAPVVAELSNGEVIAYHLPHVPSQREVEQTGVDEAFFRCIQEDTPVPVSAADGLAVMRVVEAVYHANREGCFTHVAAE